MGDGPARGAGVPWRQQQAPDTNRVQNLEGRWHRCGEQEVRCGILTHRLLLTVVVEHQVVVWLLRVGVLQHGVLLRAKLRRLLLMVVLQLLLEVLLLMQLVLCCRLPLTCSTEDQG